jgi:hypothetical protein
MNVEHRIASVEQACLDRALDPQSVLAEQRR